MPHLGALIKYLNGELRAPSESGNIFDKRLDTGVREGCQILSPTGRVRYLGWLTAMSDDVDESQKQAAEEVNGKLRSIVRILPYG